MSHTKRSLISFFFSRIYLYTCTKKILFCFSNHRTLIFIAFFSLSLILFPFTLLFIYLYDFLRMLWEKNFQSIVFKKIKLISAINLKFDSQEFTLVDIITVEKIRSQFTRQNTCLSWSSEWYSTKYFVNI